jgi:RHH-type transcriptional regulator, proline utilization regulon repressor / proline dehydrogenase / delta 1-pyrroline-5-carboxylate dehydrogenase
MTAPDSGLPIFHAPFAPPDEDLAAALLADAARDADAESRIDIRAKKLVEAIRAKAGGVGGIDDFLHAYSLSTK